MSEGRLGVGGIFFPAGSCTAMGRGAAAASCPVCLAPLGRPVDPSRAGRAHHPRERGFCPRCRTPYSFAPPLRAGDRAGGYEIIGCLATGGPGPAGWVFLAAEAEGEAATHAAPRVVLKSIRRAARHPPPRLGPHLSRRPRAAVPDPPLRHRAIVTTLGEIRHAGVVYAVMEFVAGPSLAELLRSRRQAPGAGRAPLPVAEAVAGALQLLSALRYVHERGYVFCDLAPANVVWNGDRVTLVDLQSLRPVGKRGGAFHVTAGFDAPELAMSPPSVGSDLYALGRLLATAVLDFPHRASTHRYTLPAQEVDQVLARHEPLHRFLLRATAAHPARRFASAGDMAAALTEIAASGGLQPAGLASTCAGRPLQRNTEVAGGGSGALADDGRTGDRTAGSTPRTGGR